MRRILDARGRLLRPHRHGELRRTPMSPSKCSRRSGSRAIGTVGVVLQSDLHRTEQDVERVQRARRARPAGQGRVQGTEDRSPTSARPTSMPPSCGEMRLLLTEGHYPAIATHDPAMIDATRRFATEQRHRRRPVRVPDALRHPPGPPVGARQAGLSRPRLHPLRPRSGSPISCAGSASARPTSSSCSAASSAKLADRAPEVQSRGLSSTIPSRGPSSVRPYPLSPLQIPGPHPRLSPESPVLVPARFLIEGEPSESRAASNCKG